MQVLEMIQAHPRPMNKEISSLDRLIQSALESAQATTSCADACMAEPSVSNLLRNIRINLDTADICSTTVRLLSRQTHTDWQIIRKQVDALALATRVCAEECEKHASTHKHCKICATSLRHTEQASQQLLETLPR